MRASRAGCRPPRGSRSVIACSAPPRWAPDVPRAASRGRRTRRAPCRPTPGNAAYDKIRHQFGVRTEKARSSPTAPNPPSQARRLLEVAQLLPGAVAEVEVGPAVALLQLLLGA